MKKIHIGGRKHILPSSVLFLIADVNYTKLILENGQQLYVATTLKTLQKRFLEVDYFFRPNRGNIINLKHMSAYTEQSITLFEDKVFTLSRRRRLGFFAKIKQN